MAHEHISFDDARRFADLAMDTAATCDPYWVLEYATKVRSCGECGEKARRANMLLLPDEYGDRVDPRMFGEDCLADEDLMEAEDDNDATAHLRVCAGCQLRYQVAIALVNLDAPEYTQVTADGADTTAAGLARAAADIVELPGLILRAAIQIAESWAAILRGPELASGLLGPGDEEWLSEAVVLEDHPIARARIRFDGESRLLIVSDLPESCPPDRLGARIGGAALRRVATAQHEACFDLAPVWQTGDHTLELYLMEA